MGAIMILCPRTGVHVSTGIETDKMGYALMQDGHFTMHCWRCGGDHQWSKRWARFVAEDTARPRRSQAERSRVRVQS